MDKLTPCFEVFARMARDNGDAIARKCERCDRKDDAEPPERFPPNLRLMGVQLCLDRGDGNPACERRAPRFGPRCEC